MQIFPDLSTDNVVCGRHATTAILKIHGEMGELRKFWKELLHRLRWTIANPLFDSVIIASRGDDFCIGHDFTESANETNTVEFVQVIDEVSRSRKPIVAAVDGPAIGMGAALALACQLRIGSRYATFEFPEARLGLFPIGGTIPRLVNLVGPAIALDLLASGMEIQARQAWSIGLLDRFSDSKDPLKDWLQIKPVHKPARNSALMKGNAEELARTFVRWSRVSDNQESVFAIASSVRSAVSGVPQITSTKEQQAIAELKRSPQAKALRHQYYGRLLACDATPPFPFDTQYPDCVGIVGLGNDGCLLAAELLVAGLSVRGLVSSSTAENRFRKQILNHAQRISMADISRAGSRSHELGYLQLIGDVEKVVAGDLLFIFEDDCNRADIQSLSTLADRLKKKINAVMMNAGTPRPWWSSIRQKTKASYHGALEQARVIELAEISEGRKFFAVPYVVKTASRVPIYSNVPSQSVIDRLLLHYLCAMEGFIGDRIACHAIDRQMLQFGMTIGPFELADRLGRKSILEAAKRYNESGATPVIFMPLISALVGGNKAEHADDPDWNSYRGEILAKEDVLKHGPSQMSKHQHQAQLKRSSLNPVARRALASLLAAGANLLAEGVALRASDIDVAAIHMLGFPAWLGGPLYHCDEIGLGSIYDLMDAHSTHGERGAGHSLLKKCIETDTRISELSMFTDFDFYTPGLN